MVTTPAELKAARERLGMTQQGFAEALRLPSGGRHIRKLETGQHPISGPISVAVEFMLALSATDTRSTHPMLADYHNDDTLKDRTRSGLRYELVVEKLSVAALRKIAEDPLYKLHKAALAELRRRGEPCP